MVLEIPKDISIHHPSFSLSHSLEYQPNEVLKQIFYCMGLNGQIPDIALRLYEKSVMNTNFKGKFPNMAASAWHEPKALIGQFIRNEELKITDTNSWRILKDLLIGDFDPIKTLERINRAGALDKNANPWEILKELTEFKENSRNQI